MTPKSAAPQPKQEPKQESIDVDAIFDDFKELELVTHRTNVPLPRPTMPPRHPRKGASSKRPISIESDEDDDVTELGAPVVLRSASARPVDPKGKRKRPVGELK